jgi:protein dithiol oxidoreductase (disulfide-forming)
MKFGKIVFLALIFGLTSPVSAADAGFDYAVLSPPQRTDSPGKVEVIEFFWYKCPHCYHLEPGLNQWLKTLPKYVAFKRIPAILNDNWLPMAKAYYAMEALGVTDRLHDQVFDAIHEERINLDNLDTLAAWMAKHGVGQEKFKRTYNSFSVSAKANRARQLTRSYKINGVPTLAVQGRYTTSMSMTGSESALFSTLDQLIDLSRKDSSSTH